MRNRRLPCRMAVMLPSGMRNMRTIWTKVPTSWRSSASGSCVSGLRWAMTPKIFLPFWASWMSLMLLSRPAVTGETTPGNSTVLRRGKMPTTSGTSASGRLLSSSLVTRGIKSVSSDISREKFSASMETNVRQGLCHGANQPFWHAPQTEWRGAPGSGPGSVGPSRARRWPRPSLRCIPTARGRRPS